MVRFSMWQVYQSIRFQNIEIQVFWFLYRIVSATRNILTAAGFHISGIDNLWVKGNFLFIEKL